MRYTSSIGDYAIIGNCRTAALVSRSGSLDWLCLPRFDSPSVFGALLDASKGGRFTIHPAVPFGSQRRYLGETNVLETTFATATGTVRLTDAMPVAAEMDTQRQLQPDHEVLRRVEGVTGEVEIEVVWDPRPEYARIVPSITDRGALGFLCEHGSRVLALRSDLPLQKAPDEPGVRGRVSLHAGERRYVAMSFAEREPVVLPTLGQAAEAKLQETIRCWEDWAGECRYEGPYRRAVVRSALALKLLTYAPSGAMVAAPTTSLPESVGGVRNWDYRYCWLRDASLTTRALFDLGYAPEGEAFLAWLLHATRLTWPELQVLYDVYGETRLPEAELSHLEGYAGSQPVRIGNGAKDQLQLDIYGEVVEAVFQFVRRGGRLDRASRRMLVGLGKTVCRRWREPDEGIWEIRSGRRHHTLSKVMGWLALDRLLRLHETGHLRAPVRAFAAEREAIRAAVEERGYRKSLGSYVTAFGGEELDAGLLLLGLHGYADPGSPRMRGTSARIHERLGANGLLYRYRTDDGLPPGEGAFGICSFWGVEHLARQGDAEAAAADFARVLSFANEVGLFGEEMDPTSGEALGNFPQAFTHVGLINAALTLEEALGSRRAPEERMRSRAADAL